MDRLTNEDEVVRLRGENSELRAENIDLRVKYAEVKTEQKWLIRALKVLFAVVLALIAALVLEMRSDEKKPGAKKQGATEPAGGSVDQIFQLLRRLFDVEELPRFVRTHLGPAGEAVINGLGPHTSPDDLYFKISVALTRHGAVGDLLFNALLQIRPLQRHYILRVRAECGGDGDLAAE